MNCEALLPIVASDTQGRGASSLCRAEFWESALRLLIKASRVFIVTGFYIERAGAPETDGPPGAAALGRALTRAGKSAALVTDSRNDACLRACSLSIKGPPVASIDDDNNFPMDTDLLIFIERPGHAADGRYYNMSGHDVSGVTAPLDKAAEAAMERGIPVLAIGDGGNEAGMGLLYGELAEKLPGYAPFLSSVPSSVCLPVDVSNWGAYALTAVLSVFYRRWLGLDEGEEEIMLRALAEAGAVDGVSGRSVKSVDGVTLACLNTKHQEIKNWYSVNL